MKAAAAAAALLCALLACSVAAQPGARPNTGPPKSCAASIVSSTYDSDTIVGLSQSAQLIASSDIHHDSKEVLATFSVGKRTCDFQTESILTPNATTIAAASGNGAYTFSNHDLTAVSKSAQPWQVVAYNVSGVPGNATDPSGNFNVSLTLGSVYQYSRYFGSPVVGRWALLGYLNVTILLNNNDTSGNASTTLDVYPFVSMSGDGQTVMVNYVVANCFNFSDNSIQNDTRRRSLLGPVGQASCPGASGPGGGGMSIFTWNKKTKVYEETYRTTTVLFVGPYADPWSVNPMGDAQVASLSANGKVAAIMDAYATLSVYERNKTGWAPRNTVNLTTLVPSDCPIVVGAALSKDGSWINTMVSVSVTPAYTAFWQWDKKSKTYVGVCSSELGDGLRLPAYSVDDMLYRAQYGLGETSFQRFRVGFVSVEEIARRRARTLLVPSPSGWSQTVLDFGVNDLKKGTCSPIVVFFNQLALNPELLGGAGDPERIYVTGDGLNVAYTNTNASRLLMSSLPLGGWVPPSGGGK